MRLIAFLLFVSFSILQLSRCANPVALQGGARDSTPPKLIIEESTPNFQTNFTKQAIELTFDEWVVLKDVFKQVITSPPLATRPEVSLKKRTVVLEFAEDEVLKEDATYVINFGTAIQDLTEGNKAEDLRFVFSTGNYIDSLQVSGTVVDAFSGEPAETATVMLYRNLSDTVIYNEAPFYFGSTDQQGKFKIENLKAGTYKVFAIENANQNYIYNLQEKIAFPTENLVLTDSTTANLQLRFFQEEQPLTKKSFLGKRYGLAQIVFNQKPTAAKLSFQTVGQTVLKEINGDTLKLWYDTPANQLPKWSIYLPKDSLNIDTLIVQPKLERDSFLKKNPLKLISPRKDVKSLNPAKDIQLLFNYPIVEIDTSLIQILEDSTTVISATYSLDSTNAQRSLIIKYPWKDTTLYQLTLLPNALQDLYGMTTDTLQQAYRSMAQSDFGEIDFTLTELDSTQNYVLNLYFKKENLVQSFTIQNQSNWQKNVVNLPIGEYHIELIEDTNGNSKWDVGAYLKKRQPERVYFKSLESVRANWTIEAIISLSDLQ